MMFRITIVSVFALASAVVASAGQIQVGGTTGLTNSYITNSGGSPSNACGGTCNDENNYDEVLFQNLNDAASPGTNYSINSATTNTITDNTAPAVAADGAGGVQFDLINDGTYGCSVATLQSNESCGASSNYWSLAGNGSLSTLTIPVGQYGVSQVWTMLNTNLSGASNAPADRSFFEILNFGTAGGVIESSVTIKYFNTGDTSTATGQIQSSILCTSIAPCNGITTPNGGPVQTTNPTTLTSNGVSVSADADNIFGIKYNGTGNVLTLNDTGLLLGTLTLPSVGSNLNTYLVNVQIEETGSTSYPSEYGAVSALTVVTASPEPSTVLLFLTGLGVVGFARFRRGKA
jgi:hypothetical protein